MQNKATDHQQPAAPISTLKAVAKKAKLLNQGAAKTHDVNYRLVKNMTMALW
jgi:hypothetical protein